MRLFSFRGAQLRYLLGDRLLSCDNSGTHHQGTKLTKNSLLSADSPGQILFSGGNYSSLGITRMLQKLSYRFLIPVAIVLALLPIYPQPHLVEKLRMLASGSLSKPLDIFDLIWHGWPLVLLGIKVAVTFLGKKAT